MPSWTKTKSCRSQAAGRTSAAVFQSVFENGTKIELDYYVVYFSRKRSRLASLHVLGPIPVAFVDFEFGRLLACMGDKEGARVHWQLDLLLSGKPLEINAASQKGACSLLVVADAARPSYGHPLHRASTV